MPLTIYQLAKDMFISCTKVIFKINFKFNPFIFQFDIRIYVLLTSLDPLKIYMYDDGLVRIGNKNKNVFSNHQIAM